MKPKFQTKLLVRPGTTIGYMKLLSHWIIYPSKRSKTTQVEKRKEKKETMQASIRAVIEDLGCSAFTAKATVEDQGIDTLDDLHLLKDGDIETLCKNDKCPGGAAGGNNR